MLSTLTHPPTHIARHYYRPNAPKPLNEPRKPEPLFNPERLKACKFLLDRLGRTATQHICAEITKGISLVKPLEYIQSHDRIDIPYGLFGFSLKDFYERLKMNDMYIDVLLLVQDYILDRTKLSIIMDELKSYVDRLLVGYQQNDLDSILSDIEDAYKLLTIDETLTEALQANKALLLKLEERERMFDKNAEDQNFSLDCHLFDVYSAIIDGHLLYDQIEYRYYINYHIADTESKNERLIQKEDKIAAKLNHVTSKRGTECFVHEVVQMKQKADISMLKTTLGKMAEQSNRDNELYDGQVVYYRNSLNAMRELDAELREKMEFYEREIVRLKEWNEYIKAHSRKTKKTKKSLHKAGHAVNVK